MANRAYVQELYKAGENRNSASEGVYKVSHALGPKAEAVICMGPAQTQVLILESLWESQVSIAAHPGDMDTGGSHTKELILLQGH